ncbi:MAG: hypothetical protein Q4D38_11195, partial [Planctomycetia bacterium]|nr:hypothetical protein [Planctomycetia bacterium]
MSRILTKTVVFSLVLVLGVWCLAADKEVAKAAKAKAKDMSKRAEAGKFEEKAAEGAVEVDFFKAIEDNQIDAGVIQGNIREGRVLIENKTDKPIAVRLPQAFAVRPVLAQFAGGGDNNQILGMNGMNGLGGM